MPNVLALAFHVDYWDSIGWRDHFALPTAVRRQQQYVETLGLSSAFTPQVVVDGRSSFVGSDKRRNPGGNCRAPQHDSDRASQAARGVLTVSVPERQDRDATRRQPHRLPAAGGYQRWRGENSGRTLREFNIVRQFRSLGVWNGQESVFRAPVDSFPGDAIRVAVLLQRAQQGPIVGSATALLR